MSPTPQPESDPLLAFSQEHEHSPQPAETAKDPPADDVRVRLDRVERQVERALIDITAAKSDLATLVSAVEEIRKRTSRPPDRPSTVASLPARKAAPARSVAAVVMLIGVAATIWGLVSAMTSTVPAPPRLESKTAHIIGPPPVVKPQLPYEAVAAPAAPAAAAARTPRAVKYIGTLTIDAEPAGTVFVNRKNVGRTPLRLENLRAGSHLIWIERDGYRRWTRVVSVAADRISRVSASLDPVAR